MSVAASDSPGTWTVARRQACTETGPAVIELGFRNTTGSAGRLYEGYYLPFSQLWVRSREGDDPARLTLIPRARESWASPTRLQDGVWVGDLSGIPLGGRFGRLEPGETVRRRYQVVSADDRGPRRDAYRLTAGYSFDSTDAEAAAEGDVTLEVRLA